MRVAIKKPMTEFAEKKAIAKLKGIIDKGYSQEELVSTAIEKCWQTFYEPSNREPIVSDTDLKEIAHIRKLFKEGKNERI